MLVIVRIKLDMLPPTERLNDCQSQFTPRPCLRGSQTASSIAGTQAGVASFFLETRSLGESVISCRPHQSSDLWSMQGK